MVSGWLSSRPLKMAATPDATANTANQITSRSFESRFNISGLWCAGATLEAVGRAADWSTACLDELVRLAVGKAVSTRYFDYCLTGSVELTGAL